MGNGGGGRSAGVGLWGFGSMLAITLSWSVHRSIFVDDPSRRVQLVLCGLLRMDQMTIQEV